jgi:hydroxypyruvate isomerase
MRQSFSWWAFHRNGITAEQLLKAAARIGYPAVELIGEDLWPVARDHGLEISAAGGHRSIESGLNRRENHNRIAAEIEASLAKVAPFGIKRLIVFSGSRAGLPDDEGAEITAEGLRRIGPLAEQAGVTLVLELLNSKKDHPDYQADHTAWGVRVCEAVGSPAVKLLYDIYHMQIMEGDVIATIRESSSHIAHYHTAGVPGRRDLDDEQELYYPAICRAIAATGYGGYLGHEFVPKGDPIAALEAAFKTCQV